MSLDPPMSDAEILRKHAERTGKTLNGIELGAGSPLLEKPARRVASGRKTEQDHLATEHEMQCELFTRIRDPQEQRRRPALAKVYAIPSGGFRTVAQAKKLRAEGVEPGVPDIDCPVGRAGYFGLRIEMKRPGGSIRPAQADRIASLETDGYCVCVCDSADGAWRELIVYLDSPPTVRGLVESPPPTP